ncbi:unnamed protein product, partial [Cuscuta epithymum]
MQFSAQLIHLLLLRLVRDQPEDELWFAVDGKLLKFTYQDFKRITGIHDPMEWPTYDLDEERLGVVDKYFGDCDHVSYIKLKEKLEELSTTRKDENEDVMDRVKLGSLFLVHCCLLARDYPTLIHPDYLRLVDDFELFKSCPWSFQSYKETVKSLKKTMKGQPQKFQASKNANPRFRNAKFTLYGFPFALQVWAYEELPVLAQKFATPVVPTKQIPMLKWTADGFYHAHNLQKIVFKDIVEEEENEGDVEESTDDVPNNELTLLRARIEELERRLKATEKNVAEIKDLEDTEDEEDDSDESYVESDEESEESDEVEESDEADTEESDEESDEPDNTDETEQQEVRSEDMEVPGVVDIGD